MMRNAYSFLCLLIVTTAVLASAPARADDLHAPSSPPTTSPRVVEARGFVLSLTPGATIPIGSAVTHYTAPGPSLSLDAGLRFATHGLLLAHVAGSLLPGNSDVAQDHELATPHGSTFDTGLRVGYLSSPDGVGFVASVGAAWRGYSYAMDTTPNLSYFRMGPEGQVSIGVTIPLLGTPVRLVPRIDFGAGVLVTTPQGCCAQGGLYDAILYNANLPQLPGPYGFVGFGLGVEIDTGLSRATAPTATARQPPAAAL